MDKGKSKMLADKMSIYTMRTDEKLTETQRGQIKCRITQSRRMKFRLINRCGLIKKVWIGFFV